MQINRAVQALLTVDTLIAHYVRAVDNVRRAMGFDSDTFESELRDANRVYPSIWEHLDLVRGLLAEGGREVTAFDRIRASVDGSTLLGVSTERSEIEVSYDLFNLSVEERQTLTVSFNLGGVQLAHHAATALKQAMPEVDWDGLHKLAAQPVADLKSGGNAKWAIVAIAVGLGLVFALLHYSS